MLNGKLLMTVAESMSSLEPGGAGVEVEVAVGVEVVGDVDVGVAVSVVPLGTLVAVNVGIAAVVGVLVGIAVEVGVLGTVVAVDVGMGVAVLVGTAVSVAVGCLPFPGWVAMGVGVAVGIETSGVGEGVAVVWLGGDGGAANVVRSAPSGKDREIRATSTRKTARNADGIGVKPEDLVMVTPPSSLEWSTRRWIVNQALEYGIASATMSAIVYRYPPAQS